MSPIEFETSRIFNASRERPQPMSAPSDSFNEGTVWLNHVEMGPIEYLIRGVNTLEQFQGFRLGAGLIRGKVVPSLFDRKPGGTVLIDHVGNQFRFSLFGLQVDGTTATVHVEDSSGK